MTILHAGIMILIGVLLVLLVLRLREPDRPGQHVLVPLCTMSSVGALAAATATMLDALHLPLSPFFTIESVAAALLTPFTFAWIGAWTFQPIISVIIGLSYATCEARMEEVLRRHLGTTDFYIAHFDNVRNQYTNVAGEPIDISTKGAERIVKAIHSRHGSHPATYVAFGAEVKRRHPQLLKIALATLGLALGKLQLDIHLDNRGHWEQRISTFDPEELDIFRRFAKDGETNEQIAEALHYSRGTIENRRKCIYRKLGVSDAVEAKLVWKQVMEKGD
jgi:DNA-binding CsgD family transcriptional regulator